MAEQLFLVKVEGTKELVDAVKAIEKAVLDAAPKAIELACQPTVQLMQRLAPKKTGALRNSIRFTLGARGGAARSSLTKKTRAIRRTYVVGYIVAGDQTTLKSGGTPKPRGKGTGRKGRVAVGQKWQNARLQEFGTIKMKAQPYFYPAWRATRKDVKDGIRKTMNGVIKLALAQNPTTPTSSSEAA